MKNVDNVKALPMANSNPKGGNAMCVVDGDSRAALAAKSAILVTDDFIKSRIITIRGVQVILDRDLAVLYGVEVKRLNQQVNRNLERFPERFMHQLSATEFSDLKSQIATSSLENSRDDLKSQIATSSWGGVRKPPRMFTEQGISMLSAVLHTPTAVKVSIKIMDVFVAMRQALASVAPLLSRMDTIERRQITDQALNEERFDTIFKAMDGGDLPPQKVFFDGRHYDAFSFARKLIRKAAKSIVLVDNYSDDVTLDISRVADVFDLTAFQEGGGQLYLAEQTVLFTGDRVVKDKQKLISWAVMPDGRFASSNEGTLIGFVKMADGLYASVGLVITIR